MSLATDDDVFLSLVEPLRGELTAHCYRMLGSVHDAEDLVQETYIRAWRAFHGFENRSSLRTWMYRIATNVCLTALESRQRRPLPTGLGQPASDPAGQLASRPETPWLEPLPDTVVWGHGDDDPAAAVLSRDSVRLAFVAALQHLTPPQRAVVILRDVLAWHASEVAELLDLSVAAVNSSLQRARAQLAKLDPEAALPPVEEEHAQQMLAAYVDAFERYDVSRIVELLTEDAVWEMPPFDGWYHGAGAIGTLISTHCPAEKPGDQVLVPVMANGRPALALYMLEADGRHHAFHVQVPTLTERGFSHVVAFFELSLFDRFGLPRVLPEDPEERRALRAGTALAAG
ncbi:RNA polymerase sigma-70 factor, ECF subfamily [Friedmanniella luteola]|uniref:RNA polymerase sigma-70 factor, ECF subfamily n=1 Tax=Friedmanniella luteola TaxID=546871 RepID=A0A1H1YYT5_9ACTN|nr:sigma-70 family RNA polymerase sigma factor [Friedmanniella luteola]SDT26624.1 RNA polymerase sigma-70 factor, ECF subfamily [Friedmanniella luteola]